MRSNLTYDAGMYVCPECAHEWSKSAVAESSGAEEHKRVVRDAVGNELRREASAFNSPITACLHDNTRGVIVHV